MASLRPEFHTNLVSTVQDGILYQQKHLYYFLGNIEPWADDQNPPVEPPLTQHGDTTIRDNIIFLGRVNPSDAALVVPRYNWESGEVFAQWDHTQNMVGEQFYCITDEFNVYKCLYNNRDALSTVKPTGTSLNPLETSDGYVWKFMYGVAPFKRTKFLSDEFIPVQRALTESFLNKGAIETVAVSNGGSGYIEAPLTSIEVEQTSSTTGSGALARVSAVGQYGELQGIEIISAGVGYTAGSTATIISVYGVGATLQTVNSLNGLLTSVQIVNPGTNYKVDDVVDIKVGGAVLTPIVSAVTGSIVDVVIENPGTGYQSNPTLIVRQFGNAGRGKFGGGSAVIKSVVGGGSVRHVVIEDPGIDYPKDSSTTIFVEGDGEGAVITPIVSNGIIKGVIVENTGENYTYAKLRVLGEGTGASLIAALGGIEATPLQSLVEQTTVDGAIYSINVTNAGQGYSSNTQVVISGDGIGATATAVVNSNGTIDGVEMTNFGQQYSYANISFVDSARPSPTSLVDAQAYATLPPRGGHGIDAPRELLADTVCIYTAIRGDALLVAANQNYRQYGLIEDPLNIITNARASAPSNLITFRVTVSSVTGLLPGDVIDCARKYYRIVKIEGNDIVLIQMSSIYRQPVGSFFVVGNPVTTYNILDITLSPEVDKYSGNLMYVTNEPPFTTTETQSVAIRTYLKL